MDSCEIRFYDADFSWLAATRRAASVQLTRELYGTGGFEIHLPPDVGGAAEMRKRGNIVIIEGDGHKSGVVRDFRISEGRDGSELVIYGETGDGFTKRRLTVPPTEAQVPGALGWDKVNGDAETVIKHYAAANMVTPFDGNRAFERLAMAENQGRGMVFPWKSRFAALDSELNNIGGHSEMGYEIYADLPGRRWVFDVIPGLDRTRAQAERSPVTFRMDFRNIGGYDYTEDCANYRNTGYAGGAGEDENRLIYILGAGNKGAERVEAFLDCGNSANITELRYYGEQKLDLLQAVKSIETTPDNRVFRFDRDYFLGDLVTVFVDKLGIELRVRVTAVKEIWERPTGYRLEARFGGKLPSIFTILRNPHGEVR